jgi:diguanylate cyclase (GGDEF)-like protein/excisionase family DNA binding protein
LLKLTGRSCRYLPCTEAGMTIHEATDKLLSVAQAARKLGVSAATIRRACDAGALACHRSPGGHRRISSSALAVVSRSDVLLKGRDRRSAGAGEGGLGRLSGLAALAESPADLHGLLHTIAGTLLEATGAMDCDIFLRSLGDDGHYRCYMSLEAGGEDETVRGYALRDDLHATARELLETHRPVLVADREDPRVGASERAVFERFGFVSSLSVPLLIGDRLLGVIDLYAAAPHAFDAWVDGLTSAARAVAAPIEKALLVFELERRNQVLSELLELAGMLSRTYDIEALLRTVGNRLLGAVEAVCCDIYRREGDEYRCMVSARRDGARASCEGRVLDLASHPSTAAALASGRPLAVFDVEVSELTDFEQQLMIERDLASELCIPLLAGGEPIGIVDLFDARPRDWQDCADFAAGVGQLVAGGLENARLHGRLEQRNRDLHALVAGGLEFGSTLDLGRVLHSIARKMRDATGASSVDIYETRGTMIRAVASIDAREVPDDDLIGQEFVIDDYPLTRRALQGVPVTVADITTDPRANENERSSWAAYGERSAIIVPLFNGAQPMGVASLYDKKPRVFEQADLLKGLGQVAGQAIANARLYQELERSAARAALLNEVGAELSGELEAGRLLEALARRLRAVTEVSEVTAYLLEDGGLRCVAASCEGEPIGGITKGHAVDLAGWPVSRQVIAGGGSAVVSSLDDSRLDAEGRAWLEKYGIRSFLIVPLRAKGEVAGTVELTQVGAERVFTEEEIGLVEAVCRVAGLAMENALLFADSERRNRESELLNEIARSTAASLDLGEIAGAAVQGLRTLVPIDSCSLVLREGDGWVSVWGSEALGRSRPVLPLGQGAAAILDRVRRENVLISDGVLGTGDLTGHQAVDGDRSSAVIGLFEGEDLVGLLLLESRAPQSFADVDRDMLERVGIHLSLAAHNARLYEEIKELHLNNLKGLSTALNAKDYYTLGHAARVAAYIVLLGEELGWEADALELIRDAAYLHDIGKIGVSDRVLLKQGPLNAEEWELMREHPSVSAEIIRPLFPRSLVSAVRHHHERYDGEGYPDGLAGEEIPELARALCVVDSYDAMSLQRPYRGALTWEECLTELGRCSGAQFDPGMVTAFKRVLEKLAGRRREALIAAAEAAARIDAGVHAVLQQDCDVDSPEYGEVQDLLREVLAAHPEVRFLTTETRRDKRVVIIVDAEETGAPEWSPPGEEVIADDAAQQVLAGREVTNNVLFVDNFGVWVNGIVPLVGVGGEIVAGVVADVPALGPVGTHGFARMTAVTPGSTLQEAAVRLSRAEIDAITDGLTGLYNHRHLHEVLAEHVERSVEEGAPLSLLFCDLDLFKDYNDRFGHAAGDAALRVTARVIETCTRRADLAARYGGEEFAVLLPGASRAEALAIAGRIRVAIADRYRDDGGLTISIGVATFPEDASGKATLLEVGDQAMYEAKRLGRDRVVAAG